MGRKSQQQVNTEVNRLRRVLEDPTNSEKSDYDIIQELQIKQATYYRYKAIIRQQDKDAWLEIAKESVEERSLKIMKALDFSIKVNTEIAQTSPDHKARIQATYQVVQNNIWAMELLERGPKVFPKLEGKVIQVKPATPQQEQESIRNQTV